MAYESFDRSVRVGLPPQKVWETLLDVHRVASWVSVLGELDELEPLRRYRAVLADRLGPFRLKADLDIEIDDLLENERIAAHASGEDRQVASYIEVTAAIELSEDGGGTVISICGSYEVTGRTATLGASSIRKKANQILEEFFSNVEKDCGTGSR